MGDVLFDFGKYDLPPGAREKLAKLSGIILAHSGLELDVEASVTASGFGETAPVADNLTAEGRQRNRRVEILVSGEVIGAKIGK
jgi:outer membrane protein OmpA-like peptidoglycan-associated protein